MSKFYILEGEKLVPTDLMTWAKWFDVDSNRVIGQDDIDGVFVSTVFMGVDALGFKKPFLFETMIFGWKRDYQEKYRTLKEARAGHKAAVELVKTGS